MKGYFITLEGIEGSGKTSQIARLSHRLNARGHLVLVTREPGGTRIGDQIRALILNTQNQEMDPRAELLLYLASRAQHVRQVIAPALAAGRVVLCDRFSDATLAYQGDGRGLSGAMLGEMSRFACGGRDPREGRDPCEGLVPNLTLLLDLDVKTGLARARARGDADRLEQEDASFHEKVRQGYLRLAHENPARIRVIDAEREIDVVARQIGKVVDAFLP